MKQREATRRKLACLITLVMVVSLIFEAMPMTTYAATPEGFPEYLDYAKLIPDGIALYDVTIDVIDVTFEGGIPVYSTANFTGQVISSSDATALASYLATKNNKPTAVLYEAESGTTSYFTCKLNDGSDLPLSVDFNMGEEGNDWTVDYDVYFISSAATAFYVSFITNDTSITIPTQLISKGGTVSDPNISVSGKVLTWCSDENLQNEYDFSTPITSETVLRAKWSLIRGITYYTLGGNFNGTYVTEYVEGVGVTLPTNVAKDGSTFGGWYESVNDFDGEPITTITVNDTGDKAYYAKWIGGTVYHAVRLYPNGGDPLVTDTFDVEDGQKLNLPVPTRTGNWRFDGWFTAVSGGTQVTSDTVISQSYDLYAHWTDTTPPPGPGPGPGPAPQPTMYHISYDLAGGMVDGTNPTEYNVNTEAFSLINPTKEGFVFNGWEGTDLLEATITVTIPKGSTGDRSYKATWKEDKPEITTYTISYDLDGGTVAKENPVSYTSETETFTLNNPEKDGFTFLGWEGTDLSEATITVTIAKGSTGDRTYKATWESNGSITPTPQREHSALYLKAIVTDNAKKKTSSVTFTWKSIKNAASYEVYGNFAGCDELNKITTLKKNKLSYKKNLEWDKEYVYLVKAINADGTVIEESLDVYFVTGLGNESNANSIKAGNMKVRMGETSNVVAKVTPKEKNKGVFGERYTKPLRYFSANPNIASVDDDGTVTAKSCGTVAIYIYTPNGVMKKITATVTNPLFILQAGVTENAKKHTSTVTLKWTKEAKAAKYEVCGGQYGNELVQVATLKKNKTSFVMKNLEWGKEYEYIVKAIDSNGNIIYESQRVLFVIGDKSRANASSIKASNVRLYTGATTQIAPNVISQIKGKSAIGSGDTKDLLRYFSLNPHIATVDDSGMITAVSKGTATVIVFAPNGVRKSIKATVEKP